MASPAPPASSAANGHSAQQLGVDTHSTRVDVINTQGGKILCVSDIRGALSTLNKLAAEHTAVAIIHSGDFGFYEPSSLPSISDRTLRHLVQYSSLISPAFRSALLAPNVQPAQLREMLASPPLKLPGGAPGPTVDDPSYFGLSDFPKLLAGEIKLRVPVYTVWGACEDVAVLEKIRLAAPSFLNVPASAEKLQAATGAGEGPAGRSNPATTYGYSIPNLTVLDEATTRVLLIGGVRLRLFGLGGAVVSHRLFDNGTGNATIAGGGGTMWTTVLQVGELVDTAQKVYDATETRLLVSHASPGREGLLAQLALVLKADLTVSAGLHFRYGVSYNEFSVQHDPEAYKLKLEYAKKGFNDIWDTVKSQVESVVDPNQRVLLKNALAVANRVPSSGAPSGPAGAAGTTNATEETAWKNCWNWNLPDAAYGSLLLDIVDGRIGSEMRSQGFNFAYRQNKPAPSAPAAAAAAVTASSGAQTSSTQNASTTALKSAETKVETTSVLAQAPVAPPSATATSANPNVAPPTGPSHGGPGVHRGGRGGYGERGGRGGFGPNGRTASGRGGAAVGRSNGSWSSGGERNGPEGGFRGERKERNETAAASNGSNNTNESKVHASGVAKDGDRAVDKKIEATSAAAEKEGVSSTPTTPSAPRGGRGGHNGRSERGGRHPRGGQAGHKSGGGGQLSSSSGNGAKEKEANNESLTAAPATPVASGAASGGGEASSSESAVADAPTTGTSGHGERGGRGGRGAGRGRGGGRGGRGGGNHHQTASGSVERGEGWNSSPVPKGGRVNRKENNNNDEGGKGGKSKGAAGEGEGWSAPSDAQEGGQGGW